MSYGTGLLGMVAGIGHHRSVTRLQEVEGGLDVTLDQAARGPHIFVPEGAEAEDLRHAWNAGGHVFVELGATLEPMP